MYQPCCQEHLMSSILPLLPCFISYSMGKVLRKGQECKDILFNFLFILCCYFFVWLLDIAVHFLVLLASLCDLIGKKTEDRNSGCILQLIDLITSWSQGPPLPVFFLTSLTGADSVESLMCTPPTEIRMPTAVGLSSSPEHSHICTCVHSH